MHVHILGIAGTFMAGVAALAKAAGHRVTGSDQNVYPPMSTQLQALGIDFVEGFEASQLTPRPDVVVVGNVMTRGLPVIEALLESDIPQSSGPEWLAREILRGRWVLAVAGTHGKTTTASLLAWILEHAGLEPGFLIGGAPANFETSARLGRAPFFVIEADEYDTAFFDKRAKFVHYRPRTLILNNLEFDHADIYDNVAAIERQFHHLIRTVPGSGRIVWNAADVHLARTLAMGCWTPCEGFAVRTQAVNALWTSLPAPGVTDGSAFDVLEGTTPQGRVQWALIGDHNVANALASLAAARHAGVPVALGIEALRSFKGVARRMQVRGEAGGIVVYDDFAHHPTAIHATLAGLRARVKDARIIAVLEPRSQTMRMGVHRETLAPAFAMADEIWIYAPANLGWDVQPVIAALGERGHLQRDLAALSAALARSLRSGDHVVVMSNGSFGGLHERLLAALQARFARPADA
jgi:UDP-N-acetylmuramate: L-alanyl-gamma-D-glutamyl-meso-diaminopimelate ligase